MKRGGRAWAIVAVLATGVGLSLLIWAKLKIVASIPRSAYADPQAAARAGNGPGARTQAPNAPRSEASNPQSVDSGKQRKDH